MSILRRFAFVFLVALSLLPVVSQAPPQDDATRLLGAVMGPSPMEANLRVLSDEIGGRMSGSAANRRSVEWAIEAFRSAGVDSVRTHKFTLPASWSEGATRLEIRAPQKFTPGVISIAWSPATPAGGIEAAIVDVNDGSEAEFARAGAATKGALVLVHSRLLRTWADLFDEYLRAGPGTSIPSPAKSIASRRRWWRAKMRCASHDISPPASRWARG